MKPVSVNVRLEPSGETFPVRPGESVMDAAHRANIDIPTSCGGYGTCSACRVFVERGQEFLSSRNEVEQEMADDRKFTDNERLSCQLFPLGDVTLRLPIN